MGAQGPEGACQRTARALPGLQCLGLGVHTASFLSHLLVKEPHRQPGSPTVAVGVLTS